MKVIDELVDEYIETRDSILIDRNDRYWAAQEEVRVEEGLLMEVIKVKKNVAHLYCCYWDTHCNHCSSIDR